MRRFLSHTTKSSWANLECWTWHVHARWKWIENKHFDSDRSNLTLFMAVIIVCTLFQDWNKIDNERLNSSTRSAGTRVKVNVYIRVATSIGHLLSHKWFLQIQFSFAALQPHFVVNLYLHKLHIHFYLFRAVFLYTAFDWRCPKELK